MMKTYEVGVVLKGDIGFGILVKAENSELALNQVQGMLHAKKHGWIELVNSDDRPVRVRPEKIIMLEVIDV